MMKKLATEERTMVFYESPMRLVKTLNEFINYFGADRNCCVSRELTKKFEENKRGTLQEVHDYFNEKNKFNAGLNTKMISLYVSKYLYNIILSYNNNYKFY